MKLLYEIITLLTKMQGNPSVQEGDIGKLFQGIKKGKFKSDKEAAHHFYKDIPEQNKYYWHLKYRLKEKLIDVLLTSKPDKSSTEVQKAYVECHRKLAVVQILIGFGARNSAIALAASTLKKAKKYQFTDIALALIKRLHRHYGLIEGDKKKWQNYTALLEVYNELEYLTTKAQAMYVELQFHFTQSSNHQSLQEKAKAYASELESYLQKHQSYQIGLFAYHIMVTRYQSENNNLMVIETCEKAIAFFEGLNYPTPYAVIFAFLHNLIPAHIQLSQFDKAEAVIEKALSIAPKESFNWKIVQQQRVILAFHQRNYERAYKMLESIKKSDYDWIEEKWMIFRAYMQFLIGSGQVEMLHRKFRLGRFLNQVPIYSKDKAGNNVNILIIQIVFLIHKKQFSKIIDRTEALRMYVHRYLKHPDYIRSRCFVNMLLKLSEGNFHPAAVERKAANYKAKLDAAPRSKFGNEIEIVPYEDLWKIVLDLLRS